MEDYGYLNIPKSCEVGNTIFKKLFYENVDLSTGDKKLFIDGINKITWLYCLKTETINIQPYKDEVREYTEIEVIEVEIASDIKLKRIAEIIMRTIPYPMQLIFRYESKTQFYVAHQRTNQIDSSKNTIEEFISSGWLESNSPLLVKLDIRQMRFTNFYALYSDIVDAISIYNVSEIVPAEVTLTGEQARKLAADIAAIEQEIAAIRAKLKQETQFNRKMEMSIEIKRLEREKSEMIRLVRTTSQQ